MKQWVTGVLLSFSSAGLIASDCPTPASELVHVHAKQDNGAYTLSADQKLMLFYKAPVEVETFRATLNGEDISGEFSPSASKFGEVLSLELRQGENLLELSGVFANRSSPDCIQPTQQRIRLLSAIANSEQVAGISPAH
ncbi:hypothetical protein [Litorivivens sp.]|uniref:hypothetical protein n=1 Tax=Litorivivens sp. TaxID=2020868 RepID=UPI003563A0E1